MIELSVVADFFLAFSKELVLLPLITLGFLGFDRKIFGHATFLLLFTIIYNVFLKSLFAIQLAEDLNSTGYAFPSGHMHSAYVFYGWLLLNNRNKFAKLAIGIIIAGVGFGLVNQGFHTIPDIVAAIVFGSVTLFLYTILSRSKICNEYPYIPGIIMIILSAFLMWYMEKTPQFLWMIFLALSGFTTAWAIFSETIRDTASITSAGAGFVIIIIAYYLIITFKEYLSVSPNVQWVVMGMLIPISARLSEVFRFR